MKLIKWFKKETSTSSQRIVSKRQLSEPIDPIKLSRNDSYLNALSKFNNWRQRHMSNYSKKQWKIITSKSFSRDDMNTSSLLYEDINLKSEYLFRNNLNRKKQESNFKIHSEYINYEINLAHMHDMEEVPPSSDEPEYDIPFNDSNELETFQLEENVEENFKFLEYQEFIDDNLLDSRNQLIVTDLDNSEVSATRNKENKTNGQYPSFNLNEECSEFLMCSLKQITITKDRPGFHLANGAYLDHGEVDKVDISFVKGSCWHSIINSYEKLRKLRHPHIVLLMGLSIDENAFLDAIIMEPLDNTLFNRIHFERYQLSLKDCHQYILQITNAVIYLHKLHIVHSNICSLNIFLTSGIVKLGGFELAIKLHENVMSITQMDFDMSTTSNLHYQLVSSIEYRNKYVKFNYQAPELLSETRKYVEPTYQADVYGICLTLWEILNCTVPYLHFTHQELVKVFSLKNAQLPIYEENRHLPYKNILENGLALQIVNRIQTTVDLKDLLEQLTIQDDSIDINEPKQIELPYENIGNLKKTNLELKPMIRKVCSTMKFVEPSYSPIQYTLTENLNATNQNPSLSKNGVSISGTPPIKKYCVNILVKSKNFNEEVVSRQRSNDKLNEKKEYKDSYSLSKSLNLPEGNKNTALFHRFLRKTPIASNSPPKERSTCITSTEDCYIDDDFSNVFDIGANIELNFDY